MSSQAPMRARPLALATLCLAFVAAACVGSASPTPAATPGSSPGASGSAACPAIPAPSGNPEGWAPASTTPALIPNLITDPVICGPNRILFSFVDKDLVPIATPDRSASLAIYALGSDPSKPIATVQGEFVWAVQDQVGVYVANLSFPSSGRYGAEFVTAVADAPSETIRMTFDVRPTSTLIKVGDHAPASKTPTLSDVGDDVSRISTDTNPDPAFYETSVDEAIAAHEPFVLVFATPKFCRSQQCGPTLDRLKPFANRYPTVTFINVEPYKLNYEDGGLEPDLGPEGLQTVPATAEWGLINEPILFVVDRQGVVQGVFELIFGDAELTAVLDTVK
jgi:hypothetical protein